MARHALNCNLIVLQRLRCRCNFHALKFLPKLEQKGVLIAKRMRERSSRWGPLDDEFHLDGNGFMSGVVFTLSQLAMSIYVDQLLVHAVAY